MDAVGAGAPVLGGRVRCGAILFPWCDGVVEGDRKLEAGFCLFDSFCHGPGRVARVLLLAVLEVEEDVDGRVPVLDAVFGE